MKCIFCSIENTDVIETRPNDDNTVIRRRRECLACLKRFTTYERSERSPIIVIKRDGRREKFDREKLKDGVLKAIGKTTVTASQVEKLVGEVEIEALSAEEQELSSQELGLMVAKRLKELNKVAYIRFASVFKRFEEIEDFEKEARNLE